MTLSAGITKQNADPLSPFYWQKWEEGQNMLIGIAALVYIAFYLPSFEFPVIYPEIVRLSSGDGLY